MIRPLFFLSLGSRGVSGSLIRRVYSLLPAWHITDAKGTQVKGFAPTAVWGEKR